MQKSKTFSVYALGEQLHWNEWAAISDSMGVSTTDQSFVLLFFTAL